MAAHARKTAHPVEQPSPLPVAALVFLRGQDADARLRPLQAARSALRPILGEVARAFVDRRLYHALGFRCLGDWSREKLGIGDRTVREWARVWRGLRELPRLRQAVESGEVSWTVAGKVAALATPENEAAVLECVRGRTVRAVEAMVGAYREAEGKEPIVEDEAEDRVRVSLRETPRVVGLWHAACELARRKAGQQIPVWECAEAIAAEGASAVGADPVPIAAKRSERKAFETDEDGRREAVWEWLDWRERRGAVPPEVAALCEGLDDPGLALRAIACRLETAVRLRQAIDLEMGRILRQVADRRLYRDIGFESFARYVEERLDLSPRTARRMVRLARAEHRAPEVANAFRSGEITAMQAETLLRVANPETAPRLVAHAKRVTLRRLEDDFLPAVIAFHAPREVAALFLDVVARFGLLERLLVHVIQEWTREGEHWKDHRTIERDGYRCTVPGCRARKGLESHHIQYRSHQGPDDDWNRTTLCWFHHHAGEHGKRIRIRGRAPDELSFELGGTGGETYRSGDVLETRDTAASRSIRSMPR